MPRISYETAESMVLAAFARMTGPDRRGFIKALEMYDKLADSAQNDQSAAANGKEVREEKHNDDS